MHWCQAQGCGRCGPCGLCWADDAEPRRTEHLHGSEELEPGRGGGRGSGARAVTCAAARVACAGEVGGCARGCGRCGRCGLCWADDAEPRRIEHPPLVGGARPGARRAGGQGLARGHVRRVRRSRDARAKWCWRGGGTRGRSGLVLAVRGGRRCMWAVRAAPEPYSTAGRAGVAGLRFRWGGRDAVSRRPAVAAGGRTRVQRRPLI